MIELTTHEAAEFRRAAEALRQRGAVAEADLLANVIGRLDPVEVAQFDRAAETYRAWLVFDEPKG